LSSIDDNFLLMIAEDIVSIDLTSLSGVDAVVTSVNNRLRHGSGVARTVSQLAGPAYDKACDRLLRARDQVPLTLGTAHLMTAGNLANQGVKYIVNACAMGYTPQKQVIPATFRTLTGAIMASLDEANNAGCVSILIPLMCATSGRLSAVDAAKWTVETIYKWAAYNPGGTLKRVFFNGYDFRADQHHCYEQVWRDAMDLRMQPRQTKRYLELLQVARDELLRVDYFMPFTVNGLVIGNIDEALHAGGYS
jgi:O-acetyl-ADP-ribose deacetylase (regulator of RNase III)